MPRKNNRYSQMSRQMTAILIANLLVFIVYLICAGAGVLWLKILTAIIAIIASGLCLAFLYLTKELLKPRSLWMSAAAAAILICLLFSLILNFPSPAPSKEDIIIQAQNMAISLYHP